MKPADVVADMISGLESACQMPSMTSSYPQYTTTDEAPSSAFPTTWTTGTGPYQNATTSCSSETGMPTHGYTTGTGYVPGVTTIPNGAGRSGLCLVALVIAMAVALLF
jgi:hypothetical protein